MFQDKKIQKEEDKEYCTIGKNKLVIIDWMLALIKFNRKEIYKLFNDLKVPELLLQLMERYYNHSILHKQIFRIFEEAINSENLELILIVY